MRHNLGRLRAIAWCAAIHRTSPLTKRGIMAYIQRFLRPLRKTSDCLPLAWFMAYVAMIAGMLVLLICFDMPLRLLTGLHLADIASGLPAPASVMAFYLAPLATWVGFFLFVCGAKRDRPMLRAIMPNGQGNTLRGALIGAALGFGLNGFCIGASVLTGVIDLSFSQFNLFWLLAILFAVFVQSSSEELISRVYLYQKLRRRYKNPAVAILGSALFFMALHLGNPDASVWGMVLVAVIGVFFALLVYYFNSVWACMTLHTLWNFTQNILFGLPNSGIVSQYSLFKLEAATNGFFFDPGFGVEGSPGAVLLLIAACVVLCLVGRKRNQPREDLWAAEEQAFAAAQEQAALAAPVPPASQGQAAPDVPVLPATPTSPTSPAEQEQAALVTSPAASFLVESSELAMPSHSASPASTYDSVSDGSAGGLTQ